MTTLEETACSPEMVALQALSPLDGRYSHQLKDLRTQFSEAALIQQRLYVEVVWWGALSDLNWPQFPKLAPQVISRFLDWVAETPQTQHAEQVKTIEKRINHDVKAVEYYLKLKIQQDLAVASFAEFVHFACTSEDINNLAYARMLHQTRQTVLLPCLQHVILRLREWAHQSAEVPMLSRTHGQPASPTTIGKEIANTVARLESTTAGWISILARGKINGAVGNYNAHRIVDPDVDWEAFSKQVVESMGLAFAAYSTQIEPHDWMAEYFDALSRINTVLLDFCRDIWGYISLGYFRQKLNQEEVGSSTMPHKVNPIDFENAEGNLGLANALLGHLARKLPISRWQRDLTDSTVLRSVGVGLGYSLLAWKAVLRGLDKIELSQRTIQADLENAWELLAEPIQMVMRRYGLPNPYEQLKTLTRGQSISAETIRTFVTRLNIPEIEKKRLLELTPDAYVGLAPGLAKRI